MKELEKNDKERLLQLYKSTNGNMVKYRLPVDDLNTLYDSLNDKERYNMISSILDSKSNYAYLRSPELSDIFINAIKEIANKEDFSEEAIAALNSGKDIGNMTSQELGAIRLGVRKYYGKRLTEEERKNRVHNISYFFDKLLFNLPCGATVNLLLNDYDLRDKFARFLLNSNGLNDRSSFYFYREVSKLDLNENNLYEIFSDLLAFSEEWATQFLELVKGLEVLNVGAFIDTFLYFAQAGFIYKVLVGNKEYQLSTVDKSSSLRDFYGNVSNDITFSMAYIALGSKDATESDKFYTQLIRDKFFAKVEENLHVLGIKLDYDYQCSDNYDKKL